MNESILHLRTQMEYQSKLNLRFAGGYGFTAFLVDISTLNEITYQSLVHERLRMVEGDILRLSWVSVLVPVVKSGESVGVAV